MYKKIPILIDLACHTYKHKFQAYTENIVYTRVYFSL